MSTLICQIVPQIMSEVGAIGKTRKNQAQGYSYRGIDDVTSVLQPLLAKHGVFFTSEVLSQTREERTNKNGTTLLYSILTVKFTFHAKDGSKIESVTVGEGMDSGDKASNKAMSTALKYALFQLFCIPTEEADLDTENQSHEVQPKSQPVRHAPQAQTQPVGPRQLNQRFGANGGAR